MGERVSTPLPQLPTTCAGRPAFKTSSIILVLRHHSLFFARVCDDGCLECLWRQTFKVAAKIVKTNMQKKKKKNEWLYKGRPATRSFAAASPDGYNNNERQSPRGLSPLATSARCHATQTRIARKSKWQTQRNVTRLPTSPFLLGCFYVACSLSPRRPLSTITSSSSRRVGG